MATLTNKLWGIGTLGFSLYAGVSVMFATFPGATSGIGFLERLAALAAMASAEYGPVATGLGVMVFGVVIAALCLVSGEGSSGIWSDGDGGGDGGGD